MGVVTIDIEYDDHFDENWCWVGRLSAALGHFAALATRKNFSIRLPQVHADHFQGQRQQLNQKKYQR
jgi:hypothetical protein